MTVFKNIGKYEIRRQVGRGAMGVVYEGFDLVIERRVAIKTLRLEIFDESQLADVRTRFKREAQSAGQMSHPHIVTVHDYGEQEGTPYIVMEFMTGSELSKILERGTRLPLSEVVRLMTQLLGALAYAHEHKVVHRDIKPGNIFVLDDGSLKVVDFGIARVESSNLTDTGAMLGTPAYMSPEQFLALPVDERSDIFSAGVILYELLTGDKPFTGSVTTIMQKVLRQDPIEPSVLNPLLSNAWDAVIRRAMAKKPEARFQSARQFAETIKQIFDSGSLHISMEATLPGNKDAPLAVPQGKPTSGSQPQQDGSSAVSSGGGAIPTPSRSRSTAWLKWLLISSGVLFGVAGFAAWLMVRTSECPSGVICDPIPIAELDKGKKAVEEEAKKNLAEEAAQAKAAADKLAAEKTTAERAAAEKAAVEKGVTERLAQIKAAQDREMAEQAAAQKKKTALEKTAAEKVAQEKAVAERASAEKAAQEKMAQEKAAAPKAALYRGQLPPCPIPFSVQTWSNCFGTYSSSYGNKYEGEFLSGKFHGQGTYTFATGEKYVGEFYSNIRHGKGMEYGADGRLLRSGYWKNGSFIGDN